MRASKSVRWIEVAPNTTGQISVPYPIGWDSADACSVWVSEQGNAGPIALEAQGRLEGGSVVVSTLVVPGSRRGNPPGVRGWANLPAARLALVAGCPGAQAWTVRAERRGAEEGLWLVGVQLSEFPIESRRGPVARREVLSGVTGGAPVHVSFDPGMRLLGATIAAMIAGSSATLILPFWSPDTITTAPGGAWAAEWSEEEAPVAPLGAGPGNWEATVGPDTTWAFQVGL